MHLIETPNLIIYEMLISFKKSENLCLISGNSKHPSWTLSY